MFMPAAVRPNEFERYSTIARSPSSHPNRSPTRERVEHHATTVELRFHANHDCSFAQAARKFGGRMKWSAIGGRPVSSNETKREGSARRRVARRDRLRPRPPARDKQARPLSNARRSSPIHAIPGRCRCSRCRSHCECAIPCDKFSAPHALGPQAAVARRSRPIHSPPSITPARLSSPPSHRHRTRVFR